MTRAYSNDLRERVVSAMQSGESCRAFAARFGVAPLSVVKWTDRVCRPGQNGRVSPSDPRAAPGVAVGTGPDLPACDAERPAAPAGRARGVIVSHDMVWRFLRGCGFGFKKRRWWPTSAAART